MYPAVQRVAQCRRARPVYVAVLPHFWAGPVHASSERELGVAPREAAPVRGSNRLRRPQWRRRRCRRNRGRWRSAGMIHPGRSRERARWRLRRGQRRRARSCWRRGRLFSLGRRCGVPSGAPRSVDERGRLGRRAPEEARQGHERLRVGDGLRMLGRRRRGQEPKPWLAHLYG